MERDSIHHNGNNGNGDGTRTEPVPPVTFNPYLSREEFKRRHKIYVEWANQQVRRDEVILKTEW